MHRRRVGEGEDFSPIQEAVCWSRRRNKTIMSNFIAFVVEFGFPRKSQGPHYCVTFTIADASETEVSVNMFAESIDHLPRFRSYKHLILLYNVAIKCEEGKVCAVCYAHSLSFALFDVQNQTHTDAPLQTSPAFDLQKIDMACVRRMRALTGTYQVNAARNDYLISLNHLGSRTFADLVCQVLHVEKVGDWRWMLFVWDGNDAPPLPIGTNLEDEEQNPLPLDVETITLNMSILRRFPCVGTVLRVIADVDVSVHIKEMGHWVKIRNMKIDSRFGLWIGTFLSTTKLRLLLDNEQTVRECKRAVGERGSGRQARLPLFSDPVSTLTVIDSASFPFATLMDLMTQTEAEFTVKCVVRVVAICPQDVESFRRNGDYRITLTLEDPTARIHAFLDGKHGDTFFEGLSPNIQRLKIKELLGMPLPVSESGEDGKSPRNPPWIQCCVKSNASRLYYICRTKLVA